jgi:8-oxo-dGTP diphosphatase
LEFPELHEIALRREVREETGLEIANIVPIDIQSSYNVEQDDYVFFIGYECTALSDDITLSSEHSEYRWVRKVEFLEMDATPYLKDFVRDFV